MTKRSVKRTRVQRRRVAHQRLAKALDHCSRVAVQHDPRRWAKDAALRSRGQGHARALRSVADRLLAVAGVMLESQTAFDPAHARDRAITLS